jgi:hypothetical protein
MAAPAAAAKPALPAGAPMPNGFPMFIVNSKVPSALIWPVEMQPVGGDNEEPIDIVNFFNVLWRTKAPNALIDIPNMTMMVEYSSSSYNIIIGSLGLPANITMFLPDNGTIAFWGYYKSFIPQTNKEKQQPKAEITIVCTNWDPANCVEAGPVIVVGSTCYVSHPSD